MLPKMLWKWKSELSTILTLMPWFHTHKDALIRCDQKRGATSWPGILLPLHDKTNQHEMFRDNKITDTTGSLFLVA